ncbi:PIG-L family deacetylase [Carboxylicivirga sp. N1Y90]|uniref:PIG-L family deacetylase n=1 Tax=Carboxylicivirga fragile TaxID=3417571 RepID=UPI003D332192|nr:PIG-L family deacetylase [Marinilabiliaceae bacterium N1Y90]
MQVFKLYLLTIILGVNSLCVAQAPQEKKTMMAIVAHPDDETHFSPLLAKYADSHNVYLVIVTNGDMGVRDFANIPEGKKLKKVREKEAQAACKCLGINPPVFMNYGDGKLSEWDNVYSLDEDIKALLDEYAPNVIITMGPDGGYGHPDHRVVSNIVTEVFQNWELSNTSSLFYYTITQTILDKTGDFKTPTGDFFKTNIHVMNPDFITHQISFSKEELKLGRAAFGCHESQFTPDEMDDIYQVVVKSDGIIYLRQWNGCDDNSKNDLFE